MPMVANGGEKFFGRNADVIWIVAGRFRWTETGKHGFCVGGLAEPASVLVEDGGWLVGQ